MPPPVEAPHQCPPSPALHGLHSEAGSGPRAPLRAGTGKACSGQEHIVPVTRALVSLPSLCLAWHQQTPLCARPRVLAAFEHFLSARHQGGWWVGSRSRHEQGLKGMLGALTQDLSLLPKEAPGAAWDTDVTSLSFSGRVFN